MRRENIAKRLLAASEAVLIEEASIERRVPELLHMQKAKNLFPIFYAWLSSLETTLTERSIRTYAQSLYTGFFRFMVSSEALDLSLQQIDLPLVLGFVKWIKAEKVVAKKNKGQALSAATQRSLYDSFRSLIRFASTEEKWAQESTRILQLGIPYDPWSNDVREVKYTQRLDLDHLGQIIACAEEEVMLTLHNFVDDAGLFPFRSKFPVYAQEQFGYVGQVKMDDHLKRTANNMIDLLPSQKGLTEIGSFFTSRQVGIVRWTNCFYPTTRGIIPFFILLLIAGSYNLSALCSLQRSKIRFGEVLGNRAVTLVTKKKRAKQDQTHRFLLPDDREEFSIDRILAFIESWTSRIRTLAEDQHQDYVFLVALRRRRVCVPLEMAGSSLDVAFRQFGKDNNIPAFCARQIRATILDEVHLRSGNLELVKSIARHKSINTTWHHYVSDASVIRDKAKLGLVFLLRDRYLYQDARIDPRKLASRQSKLSATPGFYCLDPYESPISGGSGRLCSSFGMCPICPNALVDVESVEDVAALQALQRRLLETAVPPASGWKEKWQPVHAALSNMLSFVPATVAASAAQLTYPFPPVD